MSLCVEACLCVSLCVIVRPSLSVCVLVCPSLCVCVIARTCLSLHVVVRPHQANRSTKKGKITPWLLKPSPVGLSQGGQSVIDVPAAWVNDTKAVCPYQRAGGSYMATGSRRVGQNRSTYSAQLSVIACQCVSKHVWVCPCASLSVQACLCASLCVQASPCLSLLVLV